MLVEEKVASISEGSIESEGRLLSMMGWESSGETVCSIAKN